MASRILAVTINEGLPLFSAFSEGNNYVVVFLKADRSCIINFEEGTLSTKVTIKVGPAGTGGAAAGSGAGNNNTNPPLYFQFGN